MDQIIISDAARRAAVETSLWDAAHTQALMDFHGAETSEARRAAWAVLADLPGAYCNAGQGDEPGYDWGSMLARMRHEYSL